MLDELRLAQKKALQEMRQEMNPVEWLWDLVWRTLWPRHYAIRNYIHIHIDVPFKPKPCSEEELAILHAEIQRMFEQ